MPRRWRNECTHFGRHLVAEPGLGQENLSVNPGPDWRLERGADVAVSQEDADLAQVDLAHSTVVLPSRAHALDPSLLVGALVQEEHPATLQARLGFDLLLDSLKDGLGRPGRVRHEVLEVLPGHPGLTPDVGEVALLLHSQQPTQVVVGILATIARLGPKAVDKALPGIVQTIAQTLDSFQRQPPALGVKEVVWVLSSDILQFLPHAPRFRKTASLERMPGRTHVQCDIAKLEYRGNEAPVRRRLWPPVHRTQGAPDPTTVPRRPERGLAT